MDNGEKVSATSHSFQLHSVYVFLVFINVTLRAYTDIIIAICALSNLYLTASKCNGAICIAMGHVCTCWMVNLFSKKLLITQRCLPIAGTLQPFTRMFDRSKLLLNSILIKICRIFFTRYQPPLGCVWTNEQLVRPDWPIYYPRAN